MEQAFSRSYLISPLSAAEIYATFKNLAERADYSDVEEAQLIFMITWLNRFNSERTQERGSLSHILRSDLLPEIDQLRFREVEVLAKQTAGILKDIDSFKKKIADVTAKTDITPQDKEARIKILMQSVAQLEKQEAGLRKKCMDLADMIEPSPELKKVCERFLTVMCMLSEKLNSDSPLGNPDYAYLSRNSIEEINATEQRLLQALKFNLGLTDASNIVKTIQALKNTYGDDLKDLAQEMQTWPGYTPGPVAANKYYPRPD